jgi:hypothetical protein
MSNARLNLTPTDDAIIILVQKVMYCSSAHLESAGSDSAFTSHKQTKDVRCYYCWPRALLKVSAVAADGWYDCTLLDDEVAIFLTVFLRAWKQDEMNAMVWYHKTSS